MAYFWRCPICDWLGTFDDDEEAYCVNEEDEEHGN